ncbi:MAG: transcription elongation factor Spt5 [Candidatus Nanoclepta minutus]|uniref:Transcription elongation factor Spt5 n=1 Tax=Candidatus Nanoclepta minutus TaxID=1940235 RepID=A0A397WNX4_9ARCH|nr:MAG: transcription elongation factor Spt5 [Candidatus Nanoclepta minutus]
MAIYVVTVTSGREDIVAEILAEEAKRKKLGIYSVTILPNVRGFIFVEAENQLEVSKAIFELRYAKKVLPEEVDIKEILQYMEEKVKPEEINEGDVVEILIGPLKGSKAKVLKVNQKKGEAMLELINVPVPINITVPINNIRKTAKEEG